MGDRFGLHAFILHGLYWDAHGFDYHLIYLADDAYWLLFVFLYHDAINSDIEHDDYV